MTDESLEDRVDALENELNHWKTKNDKIREEFEAFRDGTREKTFDLRTKLNELEESMVDIASDSSLADVERRIDELEAVLESIGDPVDGCATTKREREKHLQVVMIRRAARQSGSDDTGKYACTFSEAVDIMEDATGSKRYYQDIVRLDPGEYDGLSKGTDDAGTKVLRMNLAEVPDPTIQQFVNQEVSTVAD